MDFDRPLCLSKSIILMLHYYLISGQSKRKRKTYFLDPEPDALIRETFSITNNTVYLQGCCRFALLTFVRLLNIPPNLASTLIVRIRTTTVLMKCLSPIHNAITMRSTQHQLAVCVEHRYPTLVILFSSGHHRRHHQVVVLHLPLLRLLISTRATPTRPPCTCPPPTRLIPVFI